MGRRIFDKMLASKSENRLEPYCDPATWEELTLEERALLGDMFVIQAEKLLVEGKKKGLDYFELATAICPDDHKLFFEKGMAYALQSKSIKGLKAACKAFRLSTKLDPHFFEGWYAWARTLVEIGTLNGKGEYFVKAHKKFLDAQSAGRGELKEAILGPFHWHWGQCWYFAGKNSGELVDYRKALEHFQQASNCGMNTALFWNDYGNTLVEVSFLRADQNGYAQAIKMYALSVKLCPDFFEGWFNLASGYQYLFMVFSDANYYQKAEESFQRASEINAEHAIFWLKWGQLCISAAKFLGEEKLFFTSLEKFKEADRLEPNHSHVYRCWGEALMLCGVRTEQLSLIKLAEERLAKCLELDDSDCYSWYVYGSCYNELGHYFDDTSYYYAAIKQFQEGLKRKENDPTLWYGLALSYYALGEMTQDTVFFEHSSRCCMQVVEFGGSALPQFWNDWGMVMFKVAELTGSEKPLLSAIKMFEEALGEKRDPNVPKEPEWYLNYGNALLLLGDLRDDSSLYEKAIKVLQHALQLDPHYLQIHYHLAVAFSHFAEMMGDVELFSRAMEHFQYVVSRDAEDDIAYHDWGIALVHCALLLQDDLNPERSLRYFEEAEKKLMQALSLGNNHANYNLACLYSLLDKPASTLHYLERAEQTKTLPPVDDLMHDDWLENFRQTESFRTFLKHQEKS